MVSRFGTGLLIAACAAAAHGGGVERILFVRGGAGTGGFLEGGKDEQLSDITNDETFNGNHGWGMLADLLEAEGYVLEQMIEGPAEDNTPIDFANLDLAQYDVIVLGSNNAEYPPESVQAVVDWVYAGGGLLVISDANWGRNWGDAPTSDQPFLDPFGLIMNQDRGTYTVCRDDGDFEVDGEDRGGHPILSEVNCFKGEGVSPLTVDAPGPEVAVTILANAEGTIRVNDSDGAGSNRPAGPDDAALVIARAGAGRLAGHFDRNTFFNTNGAGTDITEFDNATYARNLYAWLAGRTCPADLDADGGVGVSDLLAFLGSWGPCDGCGADLDGSGEVDAADLLDLLAAWGPCA